ncbi:MAG TPA: glycosyltransferase family 4 protein [Kofleriaceae bacterium]|jgi:glycosyltransferase involved in cell wall biosynthesis
MARVLYINHYAGSPEMGMEFRPYYMAREWQRQGHEVRIVASTFSHLRSRNPSAPGEEVIDGITYDWIKTRPYEGNGGGRILNMLTFVAGLYRRANRYAREFRPDAVIASSTYPLDIFPAHRIARKSGARLIFEVHDLWPLSPMELGQMSRLHPFIVTMQQGEDYACKHADVVVSMLPKADEHLVTRGMSASKFVYVPNGAVLEDWDLDGAPPLPAEHAAALARYKHEKRFVVMYAGAHGLLNNMALVLEAAQRLTDTSVLFCLVGQGPEKASLQNRAAELHLSNVDFLPAVPKTVVPRLLDGADALFLSFAPQPLFRFGVSPNKLLDYMMAGKPIIAAMRAGNDPIADHALGASVAPDDPDALATAIRALAAAPELERRRMGERGQKLAREQYDYGPLARHFADQFGGRRARGAT